MTATNQVVQKIDDIEARNVNDLFSNRSYIVEAVFEYEVSQQTITDSVKFRISTEAKTEPVVTLNTHNITQTSLEFNIQIDDIDSIYILNKIELYRDEILEEDLMNLSDRIFSNLLSNNEYMIKVTYTYNLNDGNGEQTKSAQLSVITHSKNEPVIGLINEEITYRSIKSDILVSDPDNINTITKLELYKNNIFVEDKSDLVVDFSDLSSYSEYVVII